MTVAEVASILKLEAVVTGVTLESRRRDNQAAISSISTRTSQPASRRRHVRGPGCASPPQRDQWSASLTLGVVVVRRSWSPNDAERWAKRAA